MFRLFFNFIFISGLLSLSIPGHSMTREELVDQGRIVVHDHFVINSIPKCGTHYIMKCIKLMLNKPVGEGFDYIAESNFSDERMRAYINTLKECRTFPYIHKTHVPYFPAMEQAHFLANCKWVFMLRDPRDALVSLVFYLNGFQGRQRDFMHADPEVYDTLSFDEKLTALMTGGCCTNYLEVFYGPLSGWVWSPHGLTIRFEDLIGPKGGGSQERQYKALRQIADYLHVHLSEEELQAVANYAFLSAPPNSIPGVSAYKSAQTGQWRYFLSESNKAIFKTLFGEQLIALGYENNMDW